MWGPAIATVRDVGLSVYSSHTNISKNKPDRPTVTIKLEQ